MTYAASADQTTAKPYFAVTTTQGETYVDGDGFTIDGFGVHVMQNGVKVAFFADAAFVSIQRFEEEPMTAEEQAEYNAAVEDLIADDNAAFDAFSGSAAVEAEQGALYDRLIAERGANINSAMGHPADPSTALNISENPFDKPTKPGIITRLSGLTGIVLAAMLCATAAQADQVLACAATARTTGGVVVLSAAEFVLGSDDDQPTAKVYQEDAGKFVVDGDRIVFVPGEDLTEIKANCKLEGEQS